MWTPNLSTGIYGALRHTLSHFFMEFDAGQTCSCTAESQVSQRCSKFTPPQLSHIIWAFGALGMRQRTGRVFTRVFWGPVGPSGVQWGPGLEERAEANPF